MIQALDQLLFILKILFTFFTKRATLMRRSTGLPLQLVSAEIFTLVKFFVKAATGSVERRNRKAETVRRAEIHSGKPRARSGIDRPDFGFETEKRFRGKR